MPDMVPNAMDIYQELRTLTEHGQTLQLPFEADFSVVLFRPNFMLASEGYPLKAHKNQ